MLNWLINCCLTTRYPSWLYPVKMGATTIWERWDGIKPDGTFQDVGMNSFNHYAYGAVGNWLYTNVAGIQTDAENPGYKVIIIKPVISEKLEFAVATYNSMYGEIKSRWELKGEKLKLFVTVPANTSARIFIPATENAEIKDNGMPLANNDEITIVGYKEGYFVVETGSGNYEFESALNS